GFYDTADDAERLVARPADPADNATPSGGSAAAGALLTPAALTGSARYREAAGSALAVVRWLRAPPPPFLRRAAAAARAALAGPLQSAVVGEGRGSRAGLARVAGLGTAPGTVVVAGEPDAAGVPLLAHRPLVQGAAAAYVCRGFVCDAPTPDPAALAAAVRTRHA